MRLAILAGDFIHNLRSSLDHLTFQLALLGIANPPIHTGFPIFEKKHGSDGYQKKARRMLVGVPTGAVAAIEQFQPYHRGDPKEHPLWILQRLWNIDKHRELHVFGGSMNMDQYRIHYRGTGMEDGPRYRSGAFQDSDVLLSARFAPGTYVDGDVNVTFTVAFDRGGPTRGRPINIVLTDLHKHIRDEVFPALEPFFS